jgi:hypothetical protein
MDVPANPGFTFPMLLILPDMFKRDGTFDTGTGLLSCLPAMRFVRTRRASSALPPRPSSA